MASPPLALSRTALDDAAFGAASDVTPKFVSPSDSAAQWTGAMRGPAFFADADIYLIDVKFDIIMDVEASHAIRQAEVGAAQTMIERTEKRFDIKHERLAADTAKGGHRRGVKDADRRPNPLIFLRREGSNVAAGEYNHAADNVLGVPSCDNKKWCVQANNTDSG